MHEIQIMKEREATCFSRVTKMRARRVVEVYPYISTGCRGYAKKQETKTGGWRLKA